MFTKAGQYLKTRLLLGDGAETNNMDCLFCYERFEPETISNIKTEVYILAELFSTFSKYMKWESPLEYQFDFEKEHFPFCSSCSAILVQVFKLDEEIQTVVGDVISKMIDCEKQVSNGRRTDLGTEKSQFYRRQTIFKHEPSVIPMTHVQPCKLENEPIHLYLSENIITTEEVHLGPTGIHPLNISRRNRGPCASSAASSTNAHLPSKGNALNKIKRQENQQKDRESSKNIPKIHHQLKKDSNRHSCSDCQRSFSTKRHFMRHQRAVHAAESSKTFVCQVCSRKYATQYLLNSHMRLHRMMSCATCGEEVSAKRMYIHMKTHEQATPSIRNDETALTPKKFQIRTFVKSPRRDKATDKALGPRGSRKIESSQAPKDNIPPVIRNVVCSLCERSFINNWQLNRHVLSLHTDESSKTFGCQVCSRKYASQYLLDGHKKSHVLLPCPTCGKIFSRPNLYSHVKIHKQPNSK